MKVVNIFVFLLFVFPVKVFAIEYIGLINNTDSDAVKNTDKIFNELLRGKSDIHQLVDSYNKIKDEEFRQYFQFYIKVNLQHEKPTNNELKSMSRAKLVELRIAAALYLESAGEVGKSVELLKQIDKPIAQTYFARSLIVNDIDASKGINILKQLASSDEKNGYNILGAYYSERQEYKVANKYLALANDDKHPYAIYNFAVNHYYGRGIDKNIERARLLLERTRKLGLKSESGFLLGKIYFERGDNEKAIEILKESSEEENFKSSFILGKYYLSDIRNAETVSNAGHYLEHASEGGIFEAYYYLAKLNVVQYNVFGKDEFLRKAKVIETNAKKLDKSIGLKIKDLIEKHAKRQVHN
jgi:TPR repeat protein